MAADFRVNVRGGAQVSVPASLDTLTTFILLEQETWFEDELGFARACVEPGATVVDAGASFGLYTTAFADAVGGTGRVVAFEPGAATAGHLRRTLEANAFGHVALVQAALADKAGEAVLEHGGSPELHALAPVPRPQRPGENVKVVRLDDVAAEHGLGALSFLKIDAGQQYGVARGAGQLLRKAEPLAQFEVKVGDAVDLRLLDYFESLGFETYRLVPGLNLLARFQRDEPLDAFQLNLFAATPSRARALAERGLLAPGDASDVPAADAEAAAYIASLPGASRGGVPGGAYGQALGAFATLQTAELEPAQELALLRKARQAAEAALHEKASLPRALTFVRLCADLGERRRAVETLAGLMGTVRGAGLLPLGEPCLPPVPRYAALDPGPEPTQWLQCAVVEAFVRLGAFSSIFRSADSTLPMLEYLEPRAYYCAEMERRRQLLRMGSSRQGGPEPHPLLAKAAPDNLNPGFWGGRA